MVGFPMTVPGICNGPPWAATVTRQAIAPALPRRAARPLSPVEGIEHGPPLHPRTSLRSPGAAHRGATRIVRWTDPYPRFRAPRIPESMAAPLADIWPRHGHSLLGGQTTVSLPHTTP